MPALTVRGGGVSLSRAEGQEHGERCVGNLEELGGRRSLDGPRLPSLPTQRPVPVLPTDPLKPGVRVWGTGGGT